MSAPHIADIKAAFDIDATVTASGHPLGGISVEFWAWGSPPGETSSVGTDLGAAVSTADGTVTLHEPALVPDGVASRLAQIGGTNLVRVSGEVAAGTVAGKAYCAAKGDAAVTDCGAGGCAVKR